MIPNPPKSPVEPFIDPGIACGPVVNTDIDYADEDWQEKKVFSMTETPGEGQGRALGGVHAVPGWYLMPAGLQHSGERGEGLNAFGLFRLGPESAPSALLVDSPSALHTMYATPTPTP